VLTDELIAATAAFSKGAETAAPNNAGTN
jgi:hypothetical protein